jgi:hypothetical protein
VDNAVSDFHLERKLRSANTNTVLVVPATRVGRGTTVRWKTWSSLRSWLEKEDGLYVPTSHTHLIGHSGAWDNLAHWIKSEGDEVQHLSLLDATYDKFSVFRDWAKDSHHALDICVSRKTKTHTNAWSILKEQSGYYTFLKDIDPAQKSRIIYCVQSRSHMSWVIEDQPFVALLQRQRLIRDDLALGML